MYILTIVGEQIRSFAFSSRETLEEAFYAMIDRYVSHNWDFDVDSVEDIIDAHNAYGGKHEMHLSEIEVDTKEVIKMYTDTYKLR